MRTFFQAKLEARMEALQKYVAEKRAKDISDVSFYKVRASPCISFHFNFVSFYFNSVDAWPVAAVDIVSNRSESSRGARVE